MGMAFMSMGRHYGGYTRGWVRKAGVFVLIILYLIHGNGGRSLNIDMVMIST
jgi:hypothetical protein